MKYRTFGRLDWKPSALGFGAMRLPVIDGDAARIDEPEAIRMIRYAIDNGVNYVDSAYVYHGGTSEALVRKALQDGYRSKVKVATKSPVFLIKEPSDAERFFQEQLARLGLDAVDFYLLHGLDRDRWDVVRKNKVLEWADRARAEGRIRHFGFSFHDNFDLLKTIINAYDGWEYCQIQYNYMDVDYQAGAKGLKYAADKGLGVVIMEPLRGGLLATPPEPVRMALAGAADGGPGDAGGPDDAGCGAAPDSGRASAGARTPVDWALLWLWNQPEVSLVLSGMSTMDQVRENLAIASRSGVGILSAEDLRRIEVARRAMLALGWIPCTYCGYCQPCPNGVSAPDLFRLYNQVLVGGELGLERARALYRTRMTEAERASACAKCGECEEKCPQHLPISGLLAKVDEMLREEKGADR